MGKRIFEGVVAGLIVAALTPLFSSFWSQNWIEALQRWASGLGFGQLTELNVIAMMTPLVAVVALILVGLVGVAMEARGFTDGAAVRAQSFVFAFTLGGWLAYLVYLAIRMHGI